MLKAVIAVMAVIVVSVGVWELNPLAAQAIPAASRSFSPDPVGASGEVTVKITAEGYGAFADVVEELPAGFTYLSSDLPDGNVTRDGQTVTLSLIGVTSPATFTYTVTASSMEGDHPFTGVFSGVEPDFDAFSGVQVGGDSSITIVATTTPPDTGDGDTGDGDTGTTPPDAGDPTASRSFSPDPVGASGEVTVTITADGYGAFADVVEELPAGFTYLSSDLPDGNVTRDGQTVTLSLIGVTTPATFTYTVTASSMEGDHPFTGVFSGVVLNFDAFSGVQVGGDASIAVGLAAGPTASRSFPADPVDGGGEVTVTITAKGHGSFGEVTETLPAGFTYLSSSLPDDQVESEGQTVTLSLVGATSPTTFTYTVAASSVAGDHPFTGVFSGVEPDFDAFSGVQVGGDPSVTVEPTPTTRPSTGGGGGSSGGTSGGVTAPPLATVAPTATPEPVVAPEPVVVPTPVATATPEPAPEATATPEQPSMTPEPIGLTGEPGPTGQPGADGADGKDGADGRAGALGRAGADGSDGADGDPGQDGNDGAAGRDGNDGADGRDGASGTKGAKGDTGSQGGAGTAGAGGASGADGSGGGPLGIIVLIIAIVAVVAVGGVLVLGRRG